MPERMNEMNDLATMSATVTSMTLKEITDMLDVRHNNAMRTVAEMAKYPAFGLATQIEYPIISGKGKAEYIKTYQLDKRQSIAVAAHLNVALLMRIVDRWHELETKQAVIGNDHYAAHLITLGVLPGMVEWWEELVDRGYVYKQSPDYLMTQYKPSLNELQCSFASWCGERGLYFRAGEFHSLWLLESFKRSLMAVSGRYSVKSVVDELKRGDKMYLLHKLPELKSKVKQVTLLGR
jgi:hypothetical protein